MNLAEIKEFEDRVATEGVHDLRHGSLRQCENLQIYIRKKTMALDAIAREIKIAREVGFFGFFFLFSFLHVI